MIYRYAEVRVCNVTLELLQHSLEALPSIGSLFCRHNEDKVDEEGKAPPPDMKVELAEMTLDRVHQLVNTQLKWPIHGYPPKEETLPLKNLS